MKPKWEDAPEWAKFLAMDADGIWFWYENRPFLGSGRFMNNGGLAEWARFSPDWPSTLESRP